MLSSRVRRARVALSALAAAVGALVLCSPALAATTSYACTGAPQTSTVPNDAVSAVVSLQGAAGQSNAYGVLGGRGANLSLTMSAFPGRR